MKRVDIYTDGACSGNPGPGGWAAILIYKGVEKCVSGGEQNTTNNRMEIKAVIEALKMLKTKPCEVNVYSDSAYVVNAFDQHWILGWLKNGWKKSPNSDTDIKNRELWEELYALYRMHSVTFVKVKGHSDNEYNNRCDEAARKEIKKFSEKEPTEAVTI